MSPLRRLKAADVMNEYVVTARPNDSLARIGAEMENRKIGSVVIVQDSKVVGILTERDFARIVKYCTADRDLKRHLVESISHEIEEIKQELENDNFSHEPTTPSL